MMIGFSWSCQWAHSWQHILWYYKFSMIQRSLNCDKIWFLSRFCLSLYCLYCFLSMNAWVPSLQQQEQTSGNAPSIRTENTPSQDHGSFNRYSHILLSFPNHCVTVCVELCVIGPLVSRSPHADTAWSASITSLFLLILTIYTHARMPRMHAHTLLSCETSHSHSAHHLCRHHASGIHFVPSENAGGRRESEVIGEMGWTAPASHAWLPPISSMHTFLAALSCT